MAVPEDRHPQRLIREADGGIRTRSLIAFWAVVLLALPLWWWSTAVERLSLPSLSPAGRAMLGELLMNREIVVELPGRPELEAGLQGALDELLAGSPGTDELLTVRPGADSADGSLKLVVAETETDGDARHISYDYSTGSSPSQAAKAIVSQLDVCSPGSCYGRTKPSVEAADSRVVPYAPELHLRFTLLLEDIADTAAGPSEPVDWEIERALGSVIQRSLTDRLGALHNVSFSSQIQYHSPLAVTPMPAAAAAGGWIVGAEDLKAFVNSEQWTIGDDAGGTVGLGKATKAELNFMIFVPQASRRPLAFEVEGSDEVAHAFLIPQVGSVVIFNPPEDGSASSIIRGGVLRGLLRQQLAHLRILVGLPATGPNSLGQVPTRPDDWASWRSDIARLARWRTRQQIGEAIDTLDALGRLLASNSQLRVGRSARNAVRRSVDLLEHLAIELMTTGKGGKTKAVKASDVLPLAVDANRLASKAFFEPSLMGLLYFPAEHKYAVYAPLFAPVGVPLLVAAIKEVKRRRKAKRALAEAATNTAGPLSEKPELAPVAD